MDGTNFFLCALDLITMLLSALLDLGLELLDRCIRLGDARVDVLKLSDQSCRQRNKMATQQNEETRTFIRSASFSSLS